MLQLAARDRLITDLFAVLRDHQLDHLVSRAAVDALDAQLRAEEEEEEMLEQQAARNLENGDQLLFHPPSSRMKYCT